MNQYNSNEWLEAIKERRLGRFKIDYAFIRENPKEITDFLGGCLIIDARSTWLVIEYSAFNPDFDPVPDAMEIPVYIFQLTQKEGKLAEVKVIRECGFY